MLDTIFATKGVMSQAWTKQGKRLPITKCKVDQNIILGTQQCKVKVWQNTTFKNQPSLILEIGYGKKKLKNTPKPLRTIIEQSGFSFGFKQIKGVRILLDDDGSEESSFKVGQEITVDQVLSVGDVVKVQGTSKGKGFAGVIKRHGMSGGPRTHGQSDRERAVGSIGASADWGRVFKGKRMPGHMGNETKTVTNLTVVHLDPDKNEIWLSGPVPGYSSSILKITKTGNNKQIELNNQASGIEVKQDQPEAKEKSEEVTQNKSEEKPKEKSEEKPVRIEEKKEAQKDSGKSSK